MCVRALRVWRNILSFASIFIIIKFMFQEFKYLYLFLRLAARIALFACRTQQCHTSSSFIQCALYLTLKLKIFYSFSRVSFRQLLLAALPLLFSLSLPSPSSSLVLIELHTYVYLLLHIFCATTNNAIALLFCLPRIPFSHVYSFIRFTFFPVYFRMTFFIAFFRRRHFFIAHTKT